MTSREQVQVKHAARSHWLDEFEHARTVFEVMLGQRHGAQHIVDILHSLHDQCSFFSRVSQDALTKLVEQKRTAP